MKNQINIKITIDLEKAVERLRVKLYKAAHRIGNSNPGYSRVKLWYKFKIRVTYATQAFWSRKLTAWADWLGGVETTRGSRYGEQVTKGPTNRETVMMTEDVLAHLNAAEGSPIYGGYFMVYGGAAERTKRSG